MSVTEEKHQNCSLMLFAQVGSQASKIKNRALGKLFCIIFCIYTLYPESSAVVFQFLFVFYPRSNWFVLGFFWVFLVI